MRFTVKLGGSILESAEIRSEILSDIATRVRAGDEIVVVHGGGKALSRTLRRLGIESRFVDGLRVTDAETLDVAVMVLAGTVNKNLVAGLQNLGVNAVGLCGADGGAVRCVPIQQNGSTGGTLGFVGRPVAVAQEFFELLIGNRLVPVVSSIAYGQDGRFYNVNADEMASICAAETRCSALVYLTDVSGVKGKDGSLVRVLTREGVQCLRSEGVISGGMLPKTESCLAALERGIQSVYILPGASRGILCRFAEGKLDEGTCIHGHD